MCILGVLCGQVPLFDLLYSYSRAQGLSLFFRGVFENANAPSWADFITAMVGFKVFGTHKSPWQSGGTLGEFAWNQIAEEIVAFANALGGVVCVGRAGSRAAQARTKATHPSPRLAFSSPSLPFTGRPHLGTVAAYTHLAPAAAIVLSGVEEQPTTFLACAPLGAQQVLVHQKRQG